jgi:hypothetical protein
MTGVGWIFSFFIVGATILAGRWLLGLGLAKFNREVSGERDGKITSAGVAAPVMRQGAGQEAQHAGLPRPEFKDRQRFASQLHQLGANHAVGITMTAK